MAAESVSAELSSTGTILKTPVELKMKTTPVKKMFYFQQTIHFAAKGQKTNKPGSVSSSFKTTLMTDFLFPAAWLPSLEVRLWLVLGGFKLSGSTGRQKDKVMKQIQEHSDERE